MPRPVITLPPAGDLTFAPNETTKQFTVPIIVVTPLKQPDTTYIMPSVPQREPNPSRPVTDKNNAHERADGAMEFRDLQRE